jgi:hypothetical protein
MLGACSGDAKQVPAATPSAVASKPAATQRGPTPAELTQGMVEAATIGKSTVPVALKFDLSSRPSVGQPLEVILAVMPQIEAASATLQVLGSDGLQMTTGNAPIEIAPADPTQVYREKLTMTPLQEGVQLLNLSVALKHDDIVETRAFSLPVIVGPAADASSGKH